MNRLHENVIQQWMLKWGRYNENGARERGSGRSSTVEYSDVHGSRLNT